MTNVTVTNPMTEITVTVPVLDTEIIRLREEFDNGMNQKFVTFSDYVDDWVATRLVYWR